MIFYNNEHRRNGFCEPDFSFKSKHIISKHILTKGNPSNNCYLNFSSPNTNDRLVKCI